MLSAPDAAMRRKAAKHLGNPDCRDAVGSLCLALNDSSWRVRRAAAQSLGRIGDTDALPSLCLALKDPSKGVRRKVIAAIGEIGSDQGTAIPDVYDQSAEALCACLNDKSPDICSDASLSLVRIGIPAIPQVCRLPVDANSAEGGYALLTLKQIVGTHREPALWALVAESRLSPAQRWKALNSLRGFDGGRFFRAYFTDTRRFCERLRTSSHNAGVREGARTVLDYMTLARPSQENHASQQQVLLRAAHGADAASADNLLRASDAAPDMIVKTTTPFGRISAAVTNFLRCGAAVWHRVRQLARSFAGTK